MQSSDNYNPWIDLVVAMLSTGGYRMEKTFQHLEILNKNGLTDPSQIACIDQRKLALKLVESGYDRGPTLTAMYTERLSSLSALSDKKEENTRILSQGTKEEVTALLKGIKGVGPFVIDVFLSLRGLE